MNQIRNSLFLKITLAFILVAVITAGLVALLIRITSEERLSSLILDQQRNSLTMALGEYYAKNGNWDRVDAVWTQLMPQINIPQEDPAPDNRGRKPPYRSNSGLDRRQLFSLADRSGLIVVSNDPRYPQGSFAPASALKAGSPVMADNQQVGTILTANAPPRLNPEETQFLQKTNEVLEIAMLGAILVAIALGVWLARSITRPLRALTAAAHGIAEGRLEQQVEVPSGDEIGQLATAFNRMSQEVTRANQQRRQMTADIAHDLRTPLTVISGYIESMRDGVLKPTRERLGVIYDEIERLQGLVGDLKILSQADAGELPLHFVPVDPKSLLEEAAAPYRTRAEQQRVLLSVEAAEDLPAILVDEMRMMQVFANLISNALRYTGEGGKITLEGQKADKTVRLIVQDSGAGIDASELAYIFDRFRRADKSRHSESGESGLGLAIVKALVEAHGGKVSAKSQLGEGTSIIIELPAAEGRPTGTAGA